MSLQSLPVGDGPPPDATHLVGVDEAGFETAMAGQRARSEWKGTGDEAVEELHRQIANELGEVRFLGYDSTTAKAPVRALVVNGQRADRARKGDRVEKAGF